MELQEQKELKSKILAIMQRTDTCCANTPEQMDECHKTCTGHGCPHWETFANECTDVALSFLLEKAKRIVFLNNMVDYMQKEYDKQTVIMSHQHNKISDFERSLTNLRRMYLFELNEDGEPKATMKELMDEWNAVNNFLSK
jgi:hypothetical protein